MKILFTLILFLSFFLSSCSQIRESAGVSRKNIDEFQIIENPPLIMPPDFKILPPEQLEEQNIDNVESVLAKEILFGLNNENNIADTENPTSTMGNILNLSKASEVDNSIRQEINENFALEKKINSKTWENEVEILDSIAESERLRNKLLEEDAKIIKIKVKNKKKKRFFFF